MKQLRAKKPRKRTRKKPREPLAEGIVPLRKNGHRDWTSLSDDKLVACAKKFMKEKGISGKRELRKADQGLYTVLWRRKLLDNVGLEEKHRDWVSMDDKELVSYTKKFMKERGIDWKEELRKADYGCYMALHRRKLLDKVGFEGKKQRPRGFFSKMSDDEVVAFAKKVMKEKGMRRRGGLQKVDGRLYTALRLRKLMDRVGFEDKLRDWVSMSNDEIVSHAKRVMKEKGISGRTELARAYSGLYKALGRKKLLDRVGFEKKKRKERPWNRMSDEELVDHAKIVIKEKGISGRHELEKADNGLYGALRRRKLLDRVFRTIEWRKQRQADDEVIRALEEFGGAE